MAPWINDEFKVNDRLTLTLGLRFDYQSARTESDDQYSTFDPNTPNPGAGNLPGALIFAGDGPGRSGTRKFEDPKKDAWGPRVGFAYRLGDKQAIRGGYGIYYAGVAFDQFIGQPTIGFSANSAGAEPDQRPVVPAFYLDDGFPQRTIVRPPFINPTFANGTNVAGRGAGRLDAAALPELVGDVPAPAHRQHDAGRVLHRESRQPPEPPLPDAGGGRQHERSERAGAGRHVLQSNINSPRRAGRRHPPALSGLQRQRGAGAAEVSRSTRRSSGAACRPARASTTRWRSSSSAASRAASRPGSATPTPG